MAQQTQQKQGNQILMQIIVGTMMIIMSIMTILIGVSHNYKTIYIKSHCEKVTATIANAGTIETHSTTRTTRTGTKHKHRQTVTENTYTQSYDVVYKYNNKDYTTHMENQRVNSGGRMDGDVISIYVEKDNPSKVYSTNEVSGGIFEIISGLIMMVAGILIILVSKKKKKIKSGKEKI